MKKPFFVLILLLVISSAVAACDEVGRYQAIALPRTESTSYTSVMILDTKEGHLWVWTSQPSIGQTRGGVYLRYMGKVRPGKIIGELIEKWQP
jgi:hypothetical protein